MEPAGRSASDECHVKGRWPNRIGLATASRWAAPYCPRATICVSNVKPVAGSSAMALPVNTP